MKNVILASLLLSISCHSKNNKNAESNYNSTLKKDYNLIDGAWTENLSVNASFLIKKGYFYYADDEKKYRYKIVNDSIYIDLNGYYSVNYIEKINKDSMVWNNEEDGRSIFTRFK